MIRILIALCFFIVAGASSAAQAGTFRLVDPRGPNEISEVTRLYIDGKLAAVIKLDENSESVEKLIATSDARIAHRYTLCGEMTVMNHEGKAEFHRIDSEGILRRPDGHVIMAAADTDLGDFYLVDTSEPGASLHHKGRAGTCSGPVS